MLPPIALENSSLLSFDFDNLMDHQPQLLDSINNSCRPINAKDPQTNLLESSSPTAVPPCTHQHQHEKSPKAEMIEIFPSTIRFDPSSAPVLLAPESSSSASTSSAQSCETPSCSESISSFDWLQDGLSNPDVLAPTAPDLTFSFVQPPGWKPSHKNISPSTAPTPQSHNNSNIKHPALDSTPTRQDLKSKALCQFDDDDDDDDHDDDDDGKDDKGESNGDGSTGCFTRHAATAASTTEGTLYSSPLRKRMQSAQVMGSSEAWTEKMTTRAATQMGMMGPAGTGGMLATGGEKVRRKKSLGSLLGSGRLRSTTCLESQLQDVLSQAQQHHRHASCLPFVSNPLACKFPPSPSDSSLGSSAGIHGPLPQKRKNRLSAFLSFLPSENSNNSSPAHSSPTKPSIPRRSANLADKFSHSRASSLFTFDSQPGPSSSSSSSPSSPRKNQHSQAHHPLSSEPYIKSSRSLLSLLSSKLK